ncbi:hypothetical protein Dxin01_00358 [Deinococcus xinjiangensis]|uniref:ComF family protein n=2 Tax=Deinococcus xinjiangensis TaxID=457454 RepID=A0ABP9V7F8_9DEIO
MLNFLRALLPRACAGCGAQLGREAGLCAACRAQLHPQLERHSPLQAETEPHLLTLGRYKGVLRRSVRALKYGGAREMARPLGQALAAGVPAEWQIAAVVAVPLHGRRQRERGYNQAELLAQEIAAQLGVPYLSLLTRTRATEQQAKRHASERAGNLKGAFRLSGTLPSGTVLLVDDVMTTGATLLACKEALAGAKLKYAVVAR